MVNRKSWQAIRGGHGALGQGLNDVGRLAKRMRQRRGIVVAVATATAGVDHVAAVGPTRVMPKLHHFAVHVEELVELHFVPLEEPKVAGGVGVFPAEGQPGFPHSLEPNAFDGVAGGIEHFHFGIQRRLAAGGVDFHHPLFAGLGGESEHVCVVLFLAINHAGDFGWRADGHRRPWIVVGFFLGKFRLVKRGLGGDLGRLCLGEGRLRLG